MMASFSALLLVALFLCWGSFLNVVAYRLVKPNKSKKSQCPSCKKNIAWKDKIPIVSWFLLKGCCRNCKKPISVLYPFIEVLTTTIFSLAFFFLPQSLWLSAFIFYSALIVITRTDLEFMLVPETVTLYLIPVGIALSWLGLSWTNLTMSLVGTVTGYLILWVINKLFFLLTKKDGIGEGDFEILALAGSFTGLYGVWFTILIGSISASIIMTLWLGFSKKSKNIPLAFGPFLAFGAATYSLVCKIIYLYFFC